MARGDSYQLQGQQGGIVLNSSDAVSGNFRWIQVITDTVLADLLSPNLVNSTDLTSITIPAGIGIGGNFTNIEVVSGTIIAYYE
jgi:hypothetical protein